MDRLPDRHVELLDADRLLEQRRGTQGTRFGLRFPVDVRTDQDEGHLPVRAVEYGEDVEPVQLGHQVVGDDRRTCVLAFAVDQGSVLEALEQLTPSPASTTS